MRGDRSLRIALMIDTDGPGGAEMMVFRLSEELRSRGHTIVPVLPRGKVGWLGNLFRTAGYAPEETFWLKGPMDPTGVARLMRLLRQYKVDIVHSHEFTMAVYGSTAAKLLGIPHMVTLHGGLTVTKVLRRRIALRWAIGRSAHTVAVSNATRLQFAKDLGVTASAFTLVHNGVPQSAGDAERVRGEFGCKDGEIVILAVGNLERNKNHRMLLEALVRIQHEGLSVPWKVIIASGRGGSEHSHLLEYVRSHGLEDRVHVAMGRNDIPDLQALADIFAMPSLWEGLPMALLEAMVSGTSIVASETGGIPEAIVDGREGILVPPGDLHALVRGLRALMTDRSLRRALAAAARARAHREFTVQAMADRYLELYRGMHERRA
jgi:glycosyltransferase involved in cell wall biosynthesis